MHINIVIESGDKLSDQDRAVLLALAGQAVATEVGSSKHNTGVAAPAPEPAKAKAAPAAKAKPAPAPAPAPEPEADEEVAEGGATMADATALATKLVGEGRAPEVKAALTDAGVKRVSELADDQLAGFIAALDA